MVTVISMRSDNPFNLGKHLGLKPDRRRMPQSARGPIIATRSNSNAPVKGATKLSALSDSEPTRPESRREAVEQELQLDDLPFRLMDTGASNLRAPSPQRRTQTSMRAATPLGVQDAGRMGYKMGFAPRAISAWEPPATQAAAATPEKQFAADTLSLEQLATPERVSDMLKGVDSPAPNSNTPRMSHTLPMQEPAIGLEASGARLGTAQPKFWPPPYAQLDQLVTSLGGDASQVARGRDIQEIIKIRSRDKVSLLLGRKPKSHCPLVCEALDTSRAPTVSATKSAYDDKTADMIFESQQEVKAGIKSLFMRKKDTYHDYREAMLHQTHIIRK